MSELTCQELVELVTDYLEEALPANDKDCFERHLTTCSGCRNYLEQIRTSVKLAGRLKEEELQSPIKEELLKTFRNWNKGS